MGKAACRNRELLTGGAAGKSWAQPSRGSASSASRACGGTHPCRQPLSPTLVAHPHRQHLSPAPVAGCGCVRRSSPAGLAIFQGGAGKTGEKDWLHANSLSYDPDRKMVRDRHFADALSPSLLLHLRKVEGGAAE